MINFHCYLLFPPLFSLLGSRRANWLVRSVDRRIKEKGDRRSKKNRKPRQEQSREKTGKGQENEKKAGRALGCYTLASPVVGCPCPPGWWLPGEGVATQLWSCLPTIFFLNNSFITI